MSEPPLSKAVATEAATDAVAAQIFANKPMVVESWLQMNSPNQR